MRPVDVLNDLLNVADNSFSLTGPTSWSWKWSSVDAISAAELFPPWIRQLRGFQTDNHFNTYESLHVPVTVMGTYFELDPLIHHHFDILAFVTTPWPWRLVSFQ